MDILYGDYKKTTTLIDQFFIFGYDHTNKELISEAIDGYGKETENEHKNKKTPIVINSLSTLKNKKFYDETDIIQHLVPYLPNIYINTSPELIPSYDVTFSIRDEASQSIDIDKTYCYGLVFYEKYELLCLPKIFCITSQYPFFSFFKQIANKIYCEFEKDVISVPVEILLFNIINCLPPPVVTPFILDLTESNVNNKKRPIRNNFNFSKQSNNKIIQYKFPIHEIDKSCYIDYNLVYFLQVLNPDVIAKIIIFNFFEVYLVIFHKNITFLDNLIQVISLLYGPFVEIQFNLKNYAVTIEELFDINSRVVGHPTNSLFGFNGEYSSSYSFENFFTCSVCVVDINDKKQEVFMRKAIDPIQKLFNVIDNTIKQIEIASGKNTEYKPNTSFEQIISKVYLKVKSISLKARNHQTMYKEAFCDSTFNEQENYALQNVTYEYIIDMFNYYKYSNCLFKSNYVSQLIPNEQLRITQIKYDIIKNNKEQEPEMSYKDSTEINKFLQYEQYFTEELKEKDMIDMAILDSFMHYKLYYPNAQNEMNYIEVINQVYDRLKKDKNILYQRTMTFNEFNNYYKEKLESFFLKEMSKTPEIYQAYKHEENDEEYVEYSYLNKELDPKIINKYYRHLKSLSMTEFTKIFPAFNSSQKQRRVINFKLIPIIMQEIISNTIQKSTLQEILTIILNISILTIDKLYEKSPFFYVIHYCDPYPKLLLYYSLMDMITVLYIQIKLKLNNKTIDIKREMSTLCIILEFMEEKNIIPNKKIMMMLDELFLIQSKVGEDIIREKQVIVKEQFESMYDNKVKVMINKLKPKEVKKIINSYTIEQENSIVKLVKMDNTPLAEAKIEKVNDLKASTRQLINNCIISGRGLLEEEKVILKSVIVNLIAYLYANDNIKVDLTSLLDYLG